MLKISKFEEKKKDISIGDTVLVQKYTHLRPGTGKFVKKQLVKKKVIDVDEKSFLVRHGKVKMWYRKIDQIEQENQCKK